MSQFGACILSCDGPRLTADEKALFRDVRPFGFILFARHVESPSQVQDLCAELRDVAGHDCVITVDQEGGRVQRFGPPVWRQWKPALDHADATGEAERSFYLRSRLIADELRAVGLDSNCVPNLDLASDETHPFLYNRCYGRDAEEVTNRGRVMAQGHLDGGCLPIMKHMPGHGRSTLDTHKELPRVDTALELLQMHDFAPFQALNDLPMGMTAHIIFEALDPKRPATLSDRVIEMMRADLGFDGLLMTDDISMQALSGSLADRTREALAAGVDLVLHCNDTFRDRVAVAEAAEEMSKDAQTRAERALKMRIPPDEIDISAYEAELADLMGGEVYG